MDCKKPVSWPVGQASTALWLPGWGRLALCAPPAPPAPRAWHLCMLVEPHVGAQVRDTPPDRLLVGLRSGASSVKGFWLRLNGSPSEPGEPVSAVLTALPLPTKSDREQRASSIAILSQSIDALEKRLQDTSKVGCLGVLLLLRPLLAMLSCQVAEGWAVCGTVSRAEAAESRHIRAGQDSVRAAPDGRAGTAAACEGLCRLR